mgnify:CR=1 FL=1
MNAKDNIFTNVVEISYAMNVISAHTDQLRASGATTTTITQDSLDDAVGLVAKAIDYFLDIISAAAQEMEPIE